MKYLDWLLIVVNKTLKLYLVYLLLTLNIDSIKATYTYFLTQPTYINIPYEILPILSKSRILGNHTLNFPIVFEELEIMDTKIIAQCTYIYIFNKVIPIRIEINKLVWDRYGPYNQLSILEHELVHCVEGHPGHSSNRYSLMYQYEPDCISPQLLEIMYIIYFNEDKNQYK